MLEIVCLFWGLIWLLIAPERGRRGFKCVIITEGSFKSPQGFAIKPTGAVRRNQQVRPGSGAWAMWKSIRWIGALPLNPVAIYTNKYILEDEILPNHKVKCLNHTQANSQRKLKVATAATNRERESLSRAGDREGSFRWGSRQVIYLCG